MICPHCGNYLSGIAKICPMCGKALKKNQEDDRIDQQWKEKLQYTPPSYDPGPDRRPLIALIIVIVVLIVAGGTGAVLYSLKKNGPGPEENVQTYEDPVEGVQDGVLINIGEGVKVPRGLRFYFQFILPLLIGFLVIYGLVTYFR